jgi:hypothetical protein
MTFGKKDELLFQEMESRCEVGDINYKPDVRMYIIAIKALLSINDYDRAYNILQGIENQLYVKPQPQPQPSPHQHQHQRRQQRRQQSTNDNSGDNDKTNLFDLISVRPDRCMLV